MGVTVPVPLAPVAPPSPVAPPVVSSSPPPPPPPPGCTGTVVTAAGCGIPLGTSCVSKTGPKRKNALIRLSADLIVQLGSWTVAVGRIGEYTCRGVYGSMSRVLTVIFAAESLRRLIVEVVSGGLAGVEVVVGLNMFGWM